MKNKFTLEIFQPNSGPLGYPKIKTVMSSDISLDKFHKFMKRIVHKFGFDTFGEVLWVKNVENNKNIKIVFVADDNCTYIHNDECTKDTREQYRMKSPSELFKMIGDDEAEATFTDVLKWIHEFVVFDLLRYIPEEANVDILKAGDLYLSNISMKCTSCPNISLTIQTILLPDGVYEIKICDNSRSENVLIKIHNSDGHTSMNVCTAHTNNPSILSTAYSYLKHHENIRNMANHIDRKIKMNSMFNGGY